MTSTGKARHLLALSAMLPCFCALAAAAGLPSHNAPAPAPIPPVFTWQGLYVGFNYGHTWKSSSGIATVGSPLYDTTLLNLWPGAAAAGAAGLVNGRLDGFFGGAQIGYNWQFGSGVVIGVETDIQGGGVRGGGGYGSITPAAAPGASALTSANVHRSLEHFGTVRGRIGYTITPTILGYLTGGLAYGGARLTATVNQSLNPSALTTGNAHGEKFQERTGWTVGAGAEMAIAPNLSAKLEYLYYDLGSMRMLAPNFAPLMETNPITGAGIATALATSARFNGHILRTGLNYRFGGQPDGAPLPTFAPIGAERARFGDWRVSLTPYIWAIGLNGTSTALGHTSDVNVSFIDALTKSSSLPLELAANMEVRNGPFSIYGDFIWAQLRFAGSVISLRNPIAGAALTLGGDARMKMTLAILEGGGTLELARWGYSGMPAAFTAIDAVAGLRYWNIGIDLDLNIAGAVNLTNLGLAQSGSKAIARSGTMAWVDPFVGLRLRQQIDQANAFYLKGDVGGFGAGAKFSWQAMGGYTHDFQFAGLNWTSMIGYRALYVDYTKGNGLRAAGLNAVLHGPVTGFGVKF